jgi:hypothetical protein
MRSEIACIVLSLACSHPTPTAAKAATTPYTSVLIDAVPHIQQEPDFCGEACAAMWLAHLGADLDQDDFFALTKVDPSLGRGAYTKEMVRGLEAAGFDVGHVWNEIDLAHPSPAIDLQFAALHSDLVAGVPSIVCMHYDDSPHASEHFRLILGYDASTDEVIYNEPAEPLGAYRRMPRVRFLALWPVPANGGHAAIRMRLAPSASVAVVKHGHGDGRAARLAQRVRALREKLPEDFTVLAAPPFVVAGDGGRARVRSSATHTIKWAVDHLEKEFFSHEPDEILDVYLFFGRDSYVSWTKTLFDETPPTPYGYYSPHDHALIMNIATGGGTLVHEIVHPFIAANFPGCPVWFNEGLASLYEQADERDGHIIGLLNWRLAGLKTAMKDGTVPSFKALTAMDDDEFRGEHTGVNYATARYLMYYLQEHGLLHRLYREMKANHASDPTGYDTLRGVLLEGGDDMPAFERTFHDYVLALPTPTP